MRASFLGDVKMGLRYARGLSGFFRSPQTQQACEARIRFALADRSAAFLRILERGIFGHAQSPYQPLLKWAGVEFGDVVKLTEQEGVEGALERLYDAGVSITLDEFKGRRPLRRKGIDRPLHAHDFDNPLMSGLYTAQTSGSRGVRRRLVFDLELLRHEAAGQCVYAVGAGLSDREHVMWRAVPPGSAGLKIALRAVSIGRPLSAWFTPDAVSFEAPTFGTAC